MGTDNHRRPALRVAASTFFTLVSAFILLGGLGACTKQDAPDSTANDAIAMKTVVLPIEGMVCSACVARVKKTLTGIDGVGEVEVNLIERNARIRFAPSTLSADSLVATVNRLGYQAGAPMDAK